MSFNETSYPSRSLEFLHISNDEEEEEEEKEEEEKDQARLTPIPKPPPYTTPLQAKVRLDMIIAGAGLGGLTTAIALRRRGHTVTVFERAPDLGEVGAGIQIPPNSTRILLALGLGPYISPHTTSPSAIRLRRWEDGSVIGLTRLVPDFEHKYHAPYYVVHRANLQLALYRLALDLGVVVRLGRGVRTGGYDGDRARVVLEDGECVEGDLVVAADGIKSDARKLVLGGVDQPPREAGFAAYRAMVDTDKLKDDPDVSWLLDNPGQNLWIGDMRHVMAYSIAGGKSFNMVLSHPSSTDPSTWRQETAVQEMKEHFKDWDPRLVKIINQITTTSKWPLLSGVPLPTWLSRSRTLLIIGDAAHPMVPYMSSGAAMAVEDGAALAEMLSCITSRSELSSALDVFEKVRILRTGQMQEASLVNGKLWHFGDGAEQRKRDEGMGREVERGEGGDGVNPNQWSDEVTARWVYGYDAEGEVRKAWGRSGTLDSTEVVGTKL
ncbi:FAD/NAD(P)-binding domain-containing protein [Pleomassaria siparia CBS 279.74]|uniref:FAD/NAD(P)-binding domain-containing protein n=1 Tax=Pleomassaria siparia CBS 279.74 TaxID=1314801 RepID=A0A6G1JWC9_9PLEO|nr:FAD/NAD(P)-binding domain-containing protein [Pleomassaria siparia CBS 279.74]